VCASWRENQTKVPGEDIGCVHRRDILPGMQMNHQYVRFSLSPYSFFLAFTLHVPPYVSMLFHFICVSAYQYLYPDEDSTDIS
jgi:hypothetical protein